MSTVSLNIESVLQSCLEVALGKYIRNNLSVEIVGRPEKGSGYASELLFVTVKGTGKKGEKVTFNLALKCSKSSAALLDASPDIFQAYLNESYVYDTIFPLFTKFQLDRKIKIPFDSIPKCYGTFKAEKKVVIALENLEKTGYHLWDRKKPLRRDHIDLVIGEYAKYHAISVAVKEQEPEKFQELVNGLIDVFRRFRDSGAGLIELMAKTAEELGDLLKNDIEKDVLEKWMKFKDSIQSFFSDIIKNIDGLIVIVHGDCWNNNFMFKYEDDSQKKVSKVAILDWQISTVSSPILDISYFLFSCSSEEDIKDMDTILKNYHSSFSSYLKKLGTNPAIYPFENFLNEWKKYAKYGLVMCHLPIKISFIDQDDLSDISATAEEGEDISATFCVGVRDATSYKNRMIPIVKYAVESGLAC